MRFSKVKLTLIASVLILLAVALSLIPDPQARAQQASRDEVRVELNGNGFTPNEVQHAPGRFAIAVENSAISGEYKLRLKAEDGTVS